MVVTSTNTISNSISYGPPDPTMNLTTKFTVYNRSNVWYVDYSSAPLTFTCTVLETFVVMVITINVTSRF